MGWGFSSRFPRMLKCSNQGTVWHPFFLSKPGQVPTKARISLEQTLLACDSPIGPPSMHSSEVGLWNIIKECFSCEWNTEEEGIQYPCILIGTWSWILARAHLRKAWNVCEAVCSVTTYKSTNKGSSGKKISSPKYFWAKPELDPTMRMLVGKLLNLQDGWLQKMQALWMLVLFC